MKRDAMGWTHEMMLGEVKREKVRDRPGCMMVIALQNPTGHAPARSAAEGR